MATHVEVENDLSDADSSIDDQMSAYTATLTSSILNYPVEYGRRYHAYRSGSYFAPNDESLSNRPLKHEIDRLDFTHTLILKTLGGKLYMAPLETHKVQRVLDSGTGSGIWAIEMADMLENAEIIGNDLSPIQPEWVPPNVKFEVDDIESPWLYPFKFDFIFSRYLAGAIGDWPKLVGNVYDHLNSGGWAEFQDYDFLFKSDDASLTENHYTWQWNDQFVNATTSIGRESRPGPKLVEWVRNAGFVEVQHFVHKWPIGPWPKDPYYKDLGMCNLVQLLAGLEAFTFRVFCEVLGWPKEKVLAMLAKVREELKSDAFHAYGNL
ncbi:uncharacterized protein CTRU02_213583 [Colletotrichum truncatum]|uniref:Uncharacterized protein n=1 Tax=Colletotrichum truncatum TaxID=5467 RepID=A0ACC3YG47_COLTU|nr:uncharacterized protein CTRU02_12455 [Colletotrichum truncatum]KAF6784466.1 hypothetical protein CTRU02_12455 [Colletotrichum truncatum]